MEPAIDDAKIREDEDESRYTEEESSCVRPRDSSPAPELPEPEMVQSLCQSDDVLLDEIAFIKPPDLHVYASTRPRDIPSYQVHQRVRPPSISNDSDSADGDRCTVSVKTPLEEGRFPVPFGK